MQAESTPESTPGESANSGLLPQLATMLKALWAAPVRNTLLALSAALFLVIAASAYGQIRLNDWNRPFYDALSHREFSQFLRQLGIFGVIAGVLLILNVAQRWLGETLKLRLRQGLPPSSRCSGRCPMISCFMPAHASSPCRATWCGRPCCMRAPRRCSACGSAAPSWTATPSATRGRRTCASRCSFAPAAYDAALARLKLERWVPFLDVVQRWDRELSEDDQQILAFARVALHAPPWVLIDEVFDSLDAEPLARIKDLFDKDLKATGLIHIGRGTPRDGFYSRILHLVLDPHGPKLAA